MEKIKGITFAPFAPRGVLSQEKAYNGLKTMKETTNATHVIFVPAGVQETPESEEIDYSGRDTMSDEELLGMIRYAKELGLKVILKPTVNCKNGVWRAHIHFFDIDVPCEPKWKNWFASYTAFMLHYAKIAQEEQLEMFIMGCEMVMTEHRENEWRALTEEVRKCYKGLLTYNTDKYQEDHVKWWDALDLISSSGYYPVDDWENQLNRIEEVVKKYEKPFFFAEAGCMSTDTSPFIPNDWNLNGNADENAQASFYETMFEACQRRPFVEGFGLWSYDIDTTPDGIKRQEKGYEIYGKRANDVVNNFYKNWN